MSAQINLCPTHDEPLDEEGACEECFWQAADFAETRRDLDRLWNER